MDAHTHQRCRDHGTHARHRADGEVDVAGDEDVALANTDEQVLGHGAQQVHNVLPGKDRGVDDAEGNVNDDEAGEGGQSSAHATGVEKPLDGAFL